MRPLTCAASRKRRQVSDVNAATVCVSANDGRDTEARAVSGDESSGDWVWVLAVIASVADIDAEGNGFEALAHLAGGSIDADGGNEESENGGEVHFCWWW